jgi:uncharacterized protein
MKNGIGLVTAITIALGFALAGWFVGRGFFLGRASDRYVTVKGVAERDVTADVAFWPISFVSTDDDLGRAQTKIKQSREQIMAFLGRQGIDAAAVEVQRLDVRDLMADPYTSGVIKSRFIISQTLMVRSNDPEKIVKASQAASELVDAGVVLSANMGSESLPTYLFTRLNELKPGMIAEATANARQAAEQFAKDSRSTIGNIRRANQGVFEILPRDRSAGTFERTELNKTVRVVTTVEYYLED